MVADGGNGAGYPSRLVRLGRLLWAGAQVQGLFLLGFPPPPARPGRPAAPPPLRSMRPAEPRPVRPADAADPARSAR